MRISIIGAGPAGSYAASLLAKQGHEVHVFEDHDEIGVPVQCTGIVTGALWDLIPKEPSIIRTELTSVKVHGPSQHAEVRLHEYVLDRAGLDKHIAKLARQAGAKFHLGHRFIGFGKNTVKVRHNGKEREFPTDITIGADGPNSEVAKAAGIWAQRQVWGGVQATIRGDYDPHRFEVFFNRDFDRFFAWVVPESATIARIGIASQKKAREMFERITQRYPGKFVGWQSGPIPIYEKRIPVQNKERTVFLVGDAAGLVKATTGGGIITGMVSSRILADCIVKKKDYAKALKPLRKDLALHRLIRRMLNTFTDRDYDRMIRCLANPRLQAVLYNHHRDFPSKFLLKAILVEPRLLIFGQNFIKQLRLPADGVSYA
ncbi:NAD(P)/FAD-dependent oxidoreductase [Candidatus Woesearchaeota archaeon]|nr:NAD(P)/FAD-dependent oxidoreductase [Candidatus Woesearchaeota archaeon]